MPETTRELPTRLTRRGRPRAGESAAQRDAVLDAAFDLLLQRGYREVTMAAVAARAGSSKETLYAWFGDKAGLFTAMVRREAQAVNERVERALDGDGDMRSTLVAFATGLLRLLLGERSVAINRAAAGALATAPDVAAVLLAEGRHRTGPIVERYLAELAARGLLVIDEPAEAFTLLYGLAIQDWQIRVILGDPPPTDLEGLATRAADRFLALTQLSG
jgi:AcrR family transcriptional regulator